MLFKLKNYIPNDVFRTVFDIDYNKLYEQGKRIILMDIDNTLIPYCKDYPTEELMLLFQKITNIGFEIIFISNNHKRRVESFSQTINSKFINNAMKPFKKGYKKALKYVKPYGRKEIVAIGDQLMTDVLGANRFGIDVILVKPLKRVTEKWYTRLNRRIELRILNKIKKYYPKEHERFEVLDEKV